MMRKNPRLFRLSATVAIGALLCDPVWPGALAQPAPPAASAAPADQNQADPPARVGRVASQSGAVSFRTSADTQWSAARSNYPVSAGNAFWTEPTAVIRTVPRGVSTVQTSFASRPISWKYSSP